MDWKDTLGKIKETLPPEETLKWIDSHAHYYARQYSRDRDKLMKSMKKEVELIVNCGQNTAENPHVIDLIKKYDYCYGVIGYFPCFVEELAVEGAVEKLKKQIRDNKKIVGLGEIGLDYHWNKPEASIQKEWFIKQIEIADELGVPVCIHSRDAEDDTLEILTKHIPKHGCVIHCYSYGLRSAEIYAKLGYYFGVGGTLTYKGNTELREAIKYIPIEQIVLETDAPYLTPEPNRRQRNDSTQIKYVIDLIAELKGMTSDDVIKITNENVKRLYKI